MHSFQDCRHLESVRLPQRYIISDAIDRGASRCISVDVARLKHHSNLAAQAVSGNRTYCVEQQRRSMRSLQVDLKYSNALDAPCGMYLLFNVFGP
jgi:hypothetical protein